MTFTLIFKKKQPFIQAKENRLLQAFISFRTIQYQIFRSLLIKIRTKKTWSNSHVLKVCVYLESKEKANYKSILS